ncbi:MAG: hypothetical protein WD358_09240 [Nitriliruptoraceae bacterium]
MTTTAASDYHSSAEALMCETTQLASADPQDRVAAIRRLAEAIGILEEQVIADAHHAGMSWAQIGQVYGVSRQAAHRRFSNVAYVNPQDFDRLLDHLDESPEVVPALQRAADRANRRRND